MSSPTHKYQFYPSLLDKYERYCGAEDLYEKKYGSWEVGDPTRPDPPSLEEFTASLRLDLMNSINRVAEASDVEILERGKAFETCAFILGECECDTKNVIDLAVSRKEDGTMEYLCVWRSDRGLDYSFVFHYGMLNEVANKVRGSITQVFCEGTVETIFGSVRLYGFIDALRRDVVVDVKCPMRYSWSQYDGSAQRFVYPYCLSQMGCQVSAMEFVIAGHAAAYSEYYAYNDVYATHWLRDLCERFIMFIETNKTEITDKRIFNIKD